MTTAVSYIPVLHRGYVEFLASQPIDRLLLLSPEVIPSSIEYLKKDVRAVPVRQMQKAVAGLELVPQVEIATVAQLEELAKTEEKMLLPDDDSSRALVEQYFSNAQAAGRITFSPIFLRWDKKNVDAINEVTSAQKMSTDELLQKISKTAYTEAGKSSDWWRHVGAVASKDGQVLLTAFNQHLPSEQQQYTDGDARALFSAGERIELTSAIHAEAALIARAARAGISLEECELFVTTFPCPPCAKLIAAAGIKKLYFADGYAVFDGESILKAANVTIVKVEVPAEIKSLGDARSTVIPYYK